LKLNFTSGLAASFTSPLNHVEEHVCHMCLLLPGQSMFDLNTFLTGW